MRRVMLSMVLVLVAQGCRGGLPSSIRRQILADYGCRAATGQELRTEGDQRFWEVQACGQTHVLRCPAEGEGRCAYPEASDGPSQVHGGGSGDVGDAPPDTSDDPDAVVRRAIDERAAAVLSCTDGGVTAVDVSWTIEGQVHVELTGEFSATEAEECAQRALSDLPVPSGEAGRIRHPIRSPR